MRDPYLYDDIAVVKNKLGIKNNELLDQAEADITTSKLLEIDKNVKCSKSEFSFKHLQNIHKYIFEDIYEWAGEPRIINISKQEPVLNGLSVSYGNYKSIEKDINRAIEKLDNIPWGKLSFDELVKNFSKGIAEIWQIHPFREGNTRSVMKFASHYAKEHGFPLKEELFATYGKYVRNALVMSSIGQYSECHYLENIIKDAIQQGLSESLNKKVAAIDECKKSASIGTSKDHELEP